MLSVRQLSSRGLRRCLGPFVPRRLWVPFNYRLELFAGFEPELAYLNRIGPNRGVAIDVGANEGLFTYGLARLYERVHAFEINPALAARLQQWDSSRVEVHPVGLSRHEGTATLHTPYWQGRRLHGWASLESGGCPVAERYDEMQVAVRPLDAFDLQGVTFIKADVEGHEVELLAGGRETIKRNRPVILLEVKENNLAAVRSFFEGIGYVEKRLADLIGVDGSPENYIFLPATSLVA